ncbi:MAG: 30S ribosomal protein S12 methylthiotransferase RimO, partial [Caldilineaceae bacterium]
MKYHLITLGCPKNKVDSDGIEMLLRDAAYRPTDSAQQADVLIVNTCGFLEAAKEESIGVLQELGRRKRRDQVLIAAGCLAQRNGDEVLQRVPRVDGLLGTRRWMEVVELIQHLRGSAGAGKGSRSLQRYSLLGDPDQAFDIATPRPPVEAGSAYLKISDGC